MTTYAHLLTEHFDIWTAATATKSAPGRGSNHHVELYGLKKLRELILELAVRGLLVPQDQHDEPASVLLKKIAAEKARLVKEGKIKKQETLAPIREDEQPFELPMGWEWTTLERIAEIGPRNVLDDDTEVAFVPMPLISTSYKGEHGQETKKWGEIKKGYTHFRNGDIALAKITPCFENSKAAIFKDLVGGYGAGTTELHIARPIGTTASPFYILLYLKSPMFLTVGKTKMTGSAGQKRVPNSFFSKNPFPFPPLAEQHRIVAKVDELMALCDQLEQRQEASISAHHTLVRALLAALANARDPGQFADAYARIADHFDAIFTTADSIVELKQTILQLAVMGKLVRQNPADEPAAVLLKRIAAEKAKLVKAGKIKKQEQFPLIRENEQPFELPEGWEWTRLGSIAEIGPRNVLDDNTEVAFVPMPLISTSYKGEHGQETKKWGEIKKGYTHFRNGDIALAKITPCFENSKAAIFKDLVGGYGAGTTELHIARPIGTTASPFYILLYLKSPMFLTVGKTKMTGSAGQKRVPNSFFSKNPFPFPPLAEQHRIVAKVDELMAVCDRLHERITASRATQQQLADALTAQAVGGETACFHANALPS